MRRRFSVVVFFVLIAVPPIAKASHGDQWVEIRSPHFTVLSNAGEAEGRHVAAHFEDIRALFKAQFPKLRVDPGKPTIVFALKNEDSLKLLLPTYGLNKNEKRIAGLYHPSTDKNYAIVRTDMTGSARNEYHSLYHEYTHEILRLNYRGLPLWLEEGLAEFYGNSVFEGKQVSLGLVDPGQLHILQHTALIPIETLVTVDAKSPYYNAQEHAGIFYAESWALVHYFMFAPEFRQESPLNKFLATLGATDDVVEAAAQSFGDLNKLAKQIDSYAMQLRFTYGRISLQTGVSEKDFTARVLSPAEALVARAGFLLHSGSAAEGLHVLHDAEAQDAKLPAVHDGFGYYHFLQADYENAEKQFDEAIALDPNDAAAYYYKASILLRKNGYKAETTPEIRTDLEKAVALTPDFVPAHAFLCIAYIQAPETKTKAIPEGQRAMELEPGNMAYLIDFGHALLANGRIDDAQKVAERARKSATTARDRAMAANFAKQVARWNNSSEPKSAENQPAAGRSASGAASNAAPETRPVMRVAEGQIKQLICSHPPGVILTLSTPAEDILLHVKDTSKIEIRVPGQPSNAGIPPCAQWKDRKAQVTFTSAADSSVPGEAQSIVFE